MGGGRPGAGCVHGMQRKPVRGFDDGKAAQVPSRHHIHNSRTFTCLPHLACPQVHRSVVGMAGRLPPAAADALAGPLADLQAAALEAVAPTFRALVETAEELLLQMHSAPAYSAAAGGSEGGEEAGGEPGVMDTSGFMRDLARHMAHCRLEYLSKFNPSPASPIPSGEPAQRLGVRLAGRGG